VTEHPDLRAAASLFATVFAVALASSAITQPIKTALKGFLLFKGWYPEDEQSRARRYWREVVRSISAVAGGAIGLLPIWPMWVYGAVGAPGLGEGGLWGSGGWWLGGLFGLGAGISAWRIYDIWIDFLGGLPEQARAWLSRWTGGGRGGGGNKK